MECNQQTSKQNITRDMEIKSKLTVTEGSREGDNGEKKSSRNRYKGLMDNAKEGNDWEWELVMDGVGENGGGKRETAVFEQQ